MAEDILASTDVKSESTSEYLARGARCDQVMRALPFYGADYFAAWDLPAQGEYAGGARTGKAAARAYLKCLRDLLYTDSYFGGRLQLIALSMTGTLDASASLRGQIVGFFSEIDRALRISARCSPELDGVTQAELKSEIDAGLAHTKADDLAEGRRSRSQYAREGWITRRRRLGESMAGVPAALEAEAPLSN